MKILRKSFRFQVFVSFLVMALLVLGVTATSYSAAKSSEPEITENYTTYTDEMKLFSISYPSDWKTIRILNPFPVSETEKAIKNIAKKLSLVLPAEKTGIIFGAGIPVTGGYAPNVILGDAPMPMPGVFTNDQVTEAEIRGIKMFTEYFKEFSRVKIIIDGREATIIDYEAALPGTNKVHCLQMIMIVDEKIWGVICTSFTEDFARRKKDFQIIVRSLQILK